MDDIEKKIAVTTINNIALLEKLADDHGRENLNFQQLLDFARTENFKANLGNPAISFKENKKTNHIKKDKARLLLAEYKRNNP